MLNKLTKFILLLCGPLESGAYIPQRESLERRELEKVLRGAGASRTESAAYSNRLPGEVVRKLLPFWRLARAWWRAL